MKGATLLLALAALLVSDRSRAAEDSPSRVIIGYVFAENDSIDPATIAADKLTHINYAFANSRTASWSKASLATPRTSRCSPACDARTRTSRS